ncbi:MAG: PAS domain S-box protein [Candidatus Solibacter usitatus]|nr:PAS domain S-box protein [Candidatus Solibacter usitatus]
MAILSPETIGLEALRASEEKYRRLFDHSLNGLALHQIVTDGRGRPVDYIFLEVNRAFEKLTGMRAQDVLGRRVTEVVPGIEADSFIEIFGRVALSGEPVRFEKFASPLNKHYDIAAFSPRKGQFAASFSDITSQKLAEERLGQHARLLEQKNQALAKALSAVEEARELKRQFLDNMSHEVRTPMNGVLGLADLMLDTALDSEQREYAEAIKNSATSLLALLNDLLDLSKIEAGRLCVKCQPLNLAETVEAVATRFAARAQAKGLTLACAAAREARRSLLGDPLRMSQVLSNLLGNAIKFTEQGTVAVRVKLVAEETSKATFLFEVQDTGIGIPAEHRSRLFESFAQGDGSTTREHGGAGLGLAISKALVELMGGTIEVYSQAGHGSVVRFTAVFRKSTPDLEALAGALEGAAD